ncbi:hypothetical protein SAMN05216357_10361 [Porphyromonadaceae bacterium KH3CP3RA]|nr:hypothetical protein SAMN05216357_10361 [Porphyromonadaceae bacterium KH3CP3RA]
MNYFVKPNEQNQACLSYAMAKNSLTLVKKILREIRLKNKMGGLFLPGH